MPRKNHRSNPKPKSATSSRDNLTSTAPYLPNSSQKHSNNFNLPRRFTSSDNNAIQLQALDPSTLSVSQVTSIDESLSTQLNHTSRGFPRDKQKSMGLMVVKLNVMHPLAQFHALEQARTTTGGGTGSATNLTTIRHLTREEMADKIRGLIGENMRRVESGELKVPESMARILNPISDEALNLTKNDSSGGEHSGSTGSEHIDRSGGTRVPTEGKEAVQGVRRI